jgi:hypothetical protein
MSGQWNPFDNDSAAEQEPETDQPEESQEQERDARHDNRFKRRLD